MNRILFFISIILTAATLLVSCVKNYTPAAVTTNLNLLVVEGLINTGPDSTFIKLSRTAVVGNKNIANVETKATVTIENALGSLYTLKEITNGTYAAPPLNLDNTKQYRIRIKTVLGKIYLSDLVDAKVSPPIDSIGFNIKPTGMQVYANTHDATNSTHYYKYSFQEAWYFHTTFYTDFVSNGTALLHRTPNQIIYYCYAHAISSTSIINSTVSLSRDEAYHFPVTFIDSANEKIQMRYSILVSQQALTKEAYIYWDNLKKNNEQIGSVFSALPNQLTGNVHNMADASEQVIGYVTAGTTQKKRIFIDNSQLPIYWGNGNAYGCAIDSAFYNGAGHLVFTPVSYLLNLPAPAFAITGVYDKFGTILGYTFATSPCADCTTRGTIKPPAFWK